MKTMLDLPPNVLSEMQEIKARDLKGCRVRITVEEPGFSDARVRVKFPYGEVESITIGPGDSHVIIAKPHIKNQIILEALEREGDPEDPDAQGGAW